jgi:hypothetical protein
MFDLLIEAWLLLFLGSPLWVMFLRPFFVKEPRRATLLMPLYGLAIGFFLGLFGEILAAKSRGPVGLMLGPFTLAGLAIGLAMMVAGVLGITLRELLVKRQFTIKTGMIAVAVVGSLCGLARLFIP